MNEWFDADAPVWRLAGWTMLHFLWAGALVAALGAAVRIACRRASPGVRYGASLAMLAAIAGTPVVVAAVLARDPALWEKSASRRDAATVGESLRDSHSPEDQELSTGHDVAPEFASRRDAATVGESLRNSHPAAEVESGSLPGPSLGLHESPMAADEPAPEESASRRDAATVGESLRDSYSPDEASPWATIVAWLPALWLVGAPLTFAWLAAGLVGSRRLRTRSLALESGPAFEACGRLAKSLGVAQRVVVASCERVVQPVLVGIVRPVILLPAAALAGWTPEELEMVLVHELAHVRRWDNLVNFGQRIVESLLFFHPGVWLASRQVRRDREECCDALVVRHTQRPEAYASLLVSIAAAVRSEPGRPRPRPLTEKAALAAASALGGHPLKSRVRRILKLEDETMRVSRGTVGAAAALVLAMLATAALLPAGQESQADEAAVEEVEVGYRRVYPRADLQAIDFVTWNELIEKDRDWVHVSVDPLDAGHVDVVAPRHVHERIAELLEQASATRVAAALETSRAKPFDPRDVNGKSLERAATEELRTRLREEIARISAQIKEIEVVKKASLQVHWGMDFSLDEVVAAALANDASAVKLKDELRELDAKIGKRADAGNFRMDSEFKQLVDEYDALEQKYQRRYSDLVTKARTFAGDYSDDLKHAVVFGADTKLEIYEAQQRRLEKELQAVEAQLAESGDHEGQAALIADGEAANPLADEEGLSSGHNTAREDQSAVLRLELQRKLDDLNSRKRDSSHDALKSELAKLRGDIAMYQEQIIRLDEQITELELLKQRALEQAQSPNALEEAVQLAVDKDPTVNMYREQLFQLDLQIQAMTVASKNAGNAQLNRLKSSYAQLEQMMRAAEEKVRKSARERLEKLPNEVLRAAIVDYNVKKQFYEKQKQDIEAKLKAAEEKVTELLYARAEMEVLQRDVDSLEQLVQKLTVADERSTPAAGEEGNPQAQVELAPGRQVAPGEILMTIKDSHTWVAFPAGVPKSVAEKSLEELQAAGWELEDVDGRWRLKGRKAADDDSASFTLPRSNNLLASLFLELTQLDGERASAEAHLDALQTAPAEVGDEQSAALDFEIESHPVALDHRSMIDALRRKMEEYRLAARDSHDLDSDVVYQRLEDALEKQTEALGKFEDTLREQLLEERKKADRVVIEKKREELKQRLADIDAKRAVLEKRFKELTVAAQRGEATATESEDERPAGRPLSRPAGPGDAYENGLKLLELGKSREALAAFNQALAANSAFPEAHLAKGDALRAMRLYAEAAAAYSQVLQYDANSSAAYSGRAECFLAMTPPAYDLAMNDFQNALNLNRDNAAALAGLGHAYVATGQDPQRAVALLDEAILVDPQQARAYRDRGLAYAQLSEIDQAIANLQKAVELVPGDYENHSELATVYLFKQNNYRQAIDALSRAIEAYKSRAPGEPSIYARGYVLRADARLLLAEGEADAKKRSALLEDAVADADAVLARYEDRFPESGQALFRRGKAQHLLDQHAEAVNSLTKALKLTRAGDSAFCLPEAYLLRGLSWHRQGSSNLACGDLDRISLDLTSVETLQFMLDRVTAELEREQREPGPSDNSTVAYEASLRKLEATLETMIADFPGQGRPGALSRIGQSEKEVGKQPSKRRHARVKQALTPRRLALVKLLGEAPELEVAWQTESAVGGPRLAIDAPDAVFKAFWLVEGYLERVEALPEQLAKEQLPMSSTGNEDDGPEANEKFHDLFRPSDANPQVTMTHSVEAFDKLAGYEDAFHDVLQGLVKDPYGPKLPIEMKPIDDGKRLIVTAALGGQAWLRMVLAEGSPVLAAVKEQQEGARAAEEAAEAADAANPHAAVARTAVDSSRESDEPQRPWVWRAAEWPADVTPEDKERIARELAESGVRVEMSRVPDSARFAFAVRGKPGQATNSALVWEERMVDGKPRKTARVVFSFSMGFGRQGPQQRRSLRIEALPGMTFDDMLAIAQDLEAAGHEATLLKTDPVTLDVRTSLANPKPVWETRIVDGKPRTVMQLVGQPGADGDDPQTAPGQEPPGAAADDRGAMQPPRKTHEAVRALRKTFQPTADNPVETKTYRMNRAFVGLVEELAAFLHGRPNPPGEPLVFLVTRDGNDTVVKAPRSAHEYYEPLFNGESAAAEIPQTRQLAITRSRAGDVTTEQIRGVRNIYHSARLGDLFIARGFQVRTRHEGSDRGWTITVESPAEEAISEKADVAAAADIVEEGGKENPSPSPSLRGRGSGDGAVRLAPGDQVYLRAIGAAPEWPLDGSFTIEPEGTIPLGPYYGRVAIAGLTVIEAEEAIKKHLETMLTDVQLQLVLVTPTMSHDQPLRASGKLADGDAIRVLAVGTLPEHPVQNNFFIEPGGTVALGPAYGRVKVSGLTVQEAEAAIAAHLQTILTESRVQVTFVGSLREQPRPRPAPRPDAAGVIYREPSPPGDPPAAAAAAPTFRYDGKSFDDWAVLWQTELMPERRNTAIRAFAAFARVGKGREAAEALLDVAGQYNFNSVPTGPTGAEGELKRNVVELLAGNDSSGVAPTDWLPPLMKRLAADPDKWRPLAEQVFSRLTSADATARDLLLEYARDAKYGPNAMILRALAVTTREGDPRQAEVETLIRAALAGDDAKNALALFKFAGILHVHEWPEAFNLLFHQDPDVRKAARVALQIRNTTTESLNRRRVQNDALLAKLYAVIEDPERVADHADAWRTVAMLRPFIQANPTVLATAGAKLERTFEAGEPAGLVAAYVTATQLFPDEATSLQGAYSGLPEDRRKLVADQLDAEAIQTEREFRGLPPAPQPFPGR